MWFLHFPLLRSSQDALILECDRKYNVPIIRFIPHCSSQTGKMTAAVVWRPLILLLAAFCDAAVFFLSLIEISNLEARQPLAARFSGSGFWMIICSLSAAAVEEEQTEWILLWRLFLFLCIRVARSASPLLATSCSHWIHRQLQEDPSAPITQSSLALQAVSSSWPWFAPVAFPLIFSMRYNDLSVCRNTPNTRKSQCEWSLMHTERVESDFQTLSESFSQDELLTLSWTISSSLHRVNKRWLWSNEQFHKVTEQSQCMDVVTLHLAALCTSERRKERVLDIDSYRFGTRGSISHWECDQIWIPLNHRSNIYAWASFCTWVMLLNIVLRNLLSCCSFETLGEKMENQKDVTHVWLPTSA